MAIAASRSDLPAKAPRFVDRLEAGGGAPALAELALPTESHPPPPARGRARCCLATPSQPSPRKGGERGVRGCRATGTDPGSGGHPPFFHHHGADDGFLLIDPAAQQPG